MRMVADNQVQFTTDNEVVAHHYFNHLLDDGFGIPEAVIRTRAMFLCSDEFWKFISGITIIKPYDVVTMVDDPFYPGDWPDGWRPEGEYIVLTEFNDHGIFRAIKAGDNEQPVNLYIGWVKEKRS